MNKLPLINFHRHVEKRIYLTKPRGKWHAINAVKSIKSAWKIKSLDPEISLFRGTLAEEEASAALFFALKRRKYSGAEKLNWKNHVHKVGIQTIYNAIASGFKNRIWPGVELKTYLVPDTNDHGIKVEIIINEKDGTKTTYKLSEPLDFKSTIDGRPDYFPREIQELIEKEGMKSIEDYVRNWANVRNRCLYATQKGIPKVESDIKKDLLSYFNRTYRILAVFCIVDLGARQSFVEQMLKVYLHLVCKSEIDGPEPMVSA